MLSLFQKHRWWVLCFGVLLFVVLLSSALLLAFLRSRWQIVIVDDASRPADFELHARATDTWPMKFVNQLDVIVTGQIDGTAELSIEGEDPVRLSGNINHQRHGDWYDSVCRIHYEPTKVRAGQLKIRCRFR